MATSPRRRRNSGGNGFAVGLGGSSSLDDGDHADRDALILNGSGSGGSSGSSGYSNSNDNHQTTNNSQNPEGLWTGPFRPRNRAGSGSGGDITNDGRLSRRRGSSPVSPRSKSPSTRKAKYIILVLLVGIIFLSLVLVDKKSLRRIGNKDRAELKKSSSQKENIRIDNTNSRTHYKRVIGYFAIREDYHNEQEKADTFKDVHTTCHAFKKDKHCLRLPLKGKREVYMSRDQQAIYRHFLESPKLKEADPFVLGDCVPMHKWQTLSYPTCNALHESDLTHWTDHSQNFATEVRARHSSGASSWHSNNNKDDEESIRLKLVNHGHYRDVWVIPDNDMDSPEYHENNHHRVVKTLRMDQDYTPRNYDRHRRDAMAMERLTFSPYVVDIYGYCGNSGLFEYSPGGDVYNAITYGHTSMSMADKLEIAVQVAKGLADLHTFEDDGVASIAHTDFGPNQIVKVDGVFKLNDFNRARFIRKHKDTGEPCTYFVGGNPGSNRSPEEYSHGEQTERVDTFSMGNTFYVILTEHEVWHTVSTSRAQKNVERGQLPPIPREYLNSNDAAVRALLKGMDMCWALDQYERSSAREIANYLSSELDKILKAHRQGKHERKERTATVPTRRR